MPDGILLQTSLNTARSDKPARLPDQVNVNFGPTQLVGEFILKVDRRVREAGIRLSMSEDFGELYETNQKNSSDWYQLVPWYNPAYGQIEPGQGFWLRGIDASGATVLTHAVRLYPCESSTLKEEIESLRMIYSDVAHRADKRTRAVVTAPSAARIDGRITCSGALWFRSDYRGKGLAGVIPRLTRAIALTRWAPDFHVTYVVKEKAAHGITKVYGYDGHADGISIFDMPGFPSPFELVVCSKRPEKVISEIEHELGRMRPSRPMPALADMPAASGQMN